VDGHARLEAELTLLVDGQLDPERAAELEARPELAGRIAMVRAGRDQLRAAASSVDAPFELRRRLDSLSSASPRRRARWRPLAALAGLAAAVVLALVLATSGGGDPTVDGVLADTGRVPAAAVSPTGGPLLPVEVDGVRFPDYEEKFGWRAVGQRDDEIDGRNVRTVFYSRGRDRVTYSIVAGNALAEPSGRDIAAAGTRLRVVGDGAVTWKRLGHTCVMEGPALRTVSELAGWTAKGKVVF
jgi:hypothetical protein